ncbi:hypothetical protein OKW21_003275 [Catalinimonas alkaloidigena]|uniref:hypothetical protein n=1 Tax=Catalinimonas alkaloidigena TaxID=1075417 RepID=UPI002406BB24|nr:hypothetical protein [Catalinimonas alkaloidigena]MDF9798012.1 hypothetical protein [Catalinimonas alkaloidigena]
MYLYITELGKKTLKYNRGLKSYGEIGLTDHTMNAQMSMLRRFDHDPVSQSGLVDLQDIGGDRVITSVDDVINITKQNTPHVAIFWTDTHTMGYRYSHLEKEFFDNEVGLYRAKKTTDIKQIMSKTISPYGPVKGMRLLKLKA